MENNYQDLEKLYIIRDVVKKVSAEENIEKNAEIAETITKNSVSNKSHKIKRKKLTDEQKDTIGVIITGAVCGIILGAVFVATTPDAPTTGWTKDEWTSHCREQRERYVEYINNNNISDGIIDEIVLPRTK